MSAFNAFRVFSYVIGASSFPSEYFHPINGSDSFLPFNLILVVIQYFDRAGWLPMDQNLTTWYNTTLFTYPQHRSTKPGFVWARRSRALDFPFGFPSKSTCSQFLFSGICVSELTKFCYSCTICNRASKFLRRILRLQELIFAGWSSYTKEVPSTGFSGLRCDEAAFLISTEFSDLYECLFFRGFLSVSIHVASLSYTETPWDTRILWDPIAFLHTFYHRQLITDVAWSLFVLGQIFHVQF